MTNLKAILIGFQLASGLKVNFHKSILCGVNMGEEEVSAFASTLCCRTGAFPFTYLGLPIGGKPSSKTFWQPVIDRIEKRLQGWKAKFLKEEDSL